MGKVLEDCSYWYYLNKFIETLNAEVVLEDCSYWYYLNACRDGDCRKVVLEDCSYWYYLNTYEQCTFYNTFLRIVVIGII